MVVAGVDHGNSGKTIEVLAAVFVPDFCAAGVIYHDRRHRLQKAGHYVIFVFLDCVRHERLGSDSRELTTKDTKLHEGKPNAKDLISWLQSSGGTEIAIV